MITPTKGNIAVEYLDDDWSENESGIILPSQKEMRQIMKKTDRRQMSIDNKPPDVYRWGRYVAGESREKIPSGAYVYYNRHDAHEFKHEKKTYLVLPEHLALAYYVPETTPEVAA